MPHQTGLIVDHFCSAKIPPKLLKLFGLNSNLTSVVSEQILDEILETGHCSLFCPRFRDHFTAAEDVPVNPCLTPAPKAEGNGKTHKRQKKKQTDQKAKQNNEMRK